MTAPWSYSQVELRKGVKYGYADIPTIMISNQRDDFYINLLHSLLQQSIPIAFQRHLASITRMMYVALTQTSNLRTLGEEYGCIVPLSLSHSTTLSLSHRLILLLAPLIVNSIRPLQWMDELCKGIFLIEGKYPTLVHKLLNVRYIHHPPQQPIHRSAGIVCSVLGMLHILATFRQIKREIQQQSRIIAVTTNHSDDLTDEVASDEQKCPLCLGKRRNTAIATCGHLFCWNCLVEWSILREECPLCRHSCQPAHIFTIIDPYIQ